MKRPVFLGLAAIAGLGVAAASVLALATRRLDGAPGAAGPALVAAAAPGPDAVAPPEASIPPPPVQGSQGPPYLQLPPAVVARDLTAPVAPCHRVNASGLPPPAVLTLELEAQGGGALVVVDTRVASRGGASEGLLSCASEVLHGRRVNEASFSPGERFLVRYELVPAPPDASPSSEPPAAPTSVSVSRQQLRHRGGAR